MKCLGWPSQAGEGRGFGLMMLDHTPTVSKHNLVKCTFSLGQTHISEATKTDERCLNYFKGLL